ncbi:MAG: hypothetical protein H6701_11605 [Myxococcales bacterium]|nr:hypothetical protein [Myxococcales bacterium]
MKPALLALLLLAAPAAAAPAAPAPAADPAEALWDAAREARDHHHDPATAAAHLRRLIAEHPQSRPAERARAALAWIEARDPQAAADLLALQGPTPREGRWLYTHPHSPDAPLVAIRHAQKLDEADALALLQAHAPDPHWGWVVQRAIAQRLFFEGRYVDALQTADAAGDAARSTAAVRMLAWRAAAALAALLLLAAAALVIRRRRAAKPR